VLRIRDLGSGAFLTPGSGLGKKSGSDMGSRSEMNNTDNISESLKTIFWVKILKVFMVDPGFGMEKIRIWSPEGKKSYPGSGINIPDPQHCPGLSKKYAKICKIPRVYRYRYQNADFLFLTNYT
jgi:hypothetical protein